jgi:hypothetical protein
VNSYSSHICILSTKETPQIIITNPLVNQHALVENIPFGARENELYIGAEHALFTCIVIIDRVQISSATAQRLTAQVTKMQTTSILKLITVNNGHANAGALGSLACPGSGLLAYATPLAIGRK